MEPMKSIFLSIGSVSKAYSELQTETGDDRPVAYRFELQFLAVKITHVPSGEKRIAALFS